MMEDHDGSTKIRLHPQTESTVAQAVGSADRTSSKAPQVGDGKRNIKAIYGAALLTGIGVTILWGNFYRTLVGGEHERTRAWYGVGGLWVAMGIVTAAGYFFPSP